ncbi:MAG: hypothetical protein Q9218_003773 [Villophora microphyllina]
MDQTLKQAFKISAYGSVIARPASMSFAKLSRKLGPITEGTRFEGVYERGGRVFIYCLPVPGKSVSHLNLEAGLGD